MHETPSPYYLEVFLQVLHLDVLRCMGIMLLAIVIYQSIAAVHCTVPHVPHVGATLGSHQLTVPVRDESSQVVTCSLAAKPWIFLVIWLVIGS